MVLGGFGGVGAGAELGRWLGGCVVVGSGGFWGGGYGGVRLPGDGIESILPARWPLAVGAFCSMESPCTRIDVLEILQSYEAHATTGPVA